MHLSIEWLPAEQPAPQLVVLLHGAGASGTAMWPVAEALRGAFPQAAILAPDAPQAGAWFPGEAAGPSTAGRSAGTRAVDPGADDVRDDAAGSEEDRWAAGVDAAQARLADWLVAQQARLGVGPQPTALVGFDQGATLALGLACRRDGLAGRVLAFGGRFPRLPDAPPVLTTFHLLHGGADATVPASHARRALTHFGARQGDATLDIAEGIGHELHPALIDSALLRLRSHIPHRTWRAALGALPASAAGADRSH